MKKEKKADVEKTGEAIKAEMDKFKDCSFEDLREGFIDFSKQMIDFQIHVLNVLEKSKKETMDFVCKYLKQANAVNAKDFETGEKNFREIDERYKYHHEKISQVAAASVIALIRSVCITQKLYQAGLLKERINERAMMKLLPSETMLLLFKWHKGTFQTILTSSHLIRGQKGAAGGWAVFRSGGRLIVNRELFPFFSVGFLQIRT
jgi:hypothetical protein